jgi:glycosyltransferase involved in cell wall biosynthesis
MLAATQRRADSRSGSDIPLRVLKVVTAYPSKRWPAFGTYVFNEVQALRRAGVHVDVLWINGRASKWRYLVGQFQFWRAIRRRRYDLIHAHYVFAGVVARAQWGQRLVVTHHGPEVIGHPRWQTWLARAVTPLFDEVIYRTEEMRLSLNDRDGWVIPGGIDIDRFAPMPRDEARSVLGLPTDRTIILWAGEYWRPEKCFWLAQEAVEQLKTRLDNVELLLLTEKPQDAVPLYMCAADALILTSSHEGSPNVVKEALACNVPVVSVSVGDVPHLIEGVQACALAERDPVDLATKLAEVVSPPRRSNGRARVSGLTHDRVAEAVVNVYLRAVGREGAWREGD